MAQEPDALKEGATPPDQSGDLPTDPGNDVDPGGDDPLPVEEAPPPHDSPPADPETGPGESEPLEAEPLNDPTYPPPAPAQPPPALGSPPAPPPSGFNIEPPPPVETPPSSPPPTAAPEASTPQALTDPEAPALAGQEPGRLFAGRVELAIRDVPPAAPAAGIPLTVDGAATAPVKADLASASTTSTRSTSRARSTRRASAPADGARFHRVKPGESLWVIAERGLGSRPAVAAVAREVERLWALNEERIGTGDPDRLMAGTRLRLR